MKKRSENIILCLLLFFFILLCFIYYIEPYDDSFISYRVARNLKQGYGFRFNNGGEKLEGFSNFLWVVILNFLAQFSIPLVNSSTWLGLLFSLGTIFVSYQIAQRLFPKFTLIVPLLIILSDFFIVNSLNGLETSLFSFLFILTAYLFISGHFSNTSSAKETLYLIFASASSFLVAAVRPEGILIFLSLTFFLIREEYPKKNLKKILSFILPCLFFYLPYTLWRYLYFGELLPNTFYARQLILFPSLSKQLLMGGLYFLTFFMDQLHFLLIFLFLPLIFTKKIEKEFKCLLFLLLSYLGFIFLAGGDWNHMFGTFRFMMPLVAIFSLLALKEWSILSRNSKRGIPCLLVLCLFFSQFNFTNVTRYPDYIALEMARRDTIFTTVKNIFHSPQLIKNKIINFLTSDGKIHLDAKAGLWLKEHFKKEHLLASEQAGRLAFFSELPFIDLAGLVSHSIAHLTPGEYLGGKYIKYIFNQSPELFIFPIINLNKGSDLFSKYLKEQDYFLFKIFCYKDSIYLFKDIYKQMYTNPDYLPPQDLQIYYLCLFAKNRSKEKSIIPKEKKVHILFEDRWYAIQEKDLIPF
ncbi:hypothetical protein ACFLQ1_01840 [Candidatus Auribacterota bacterium]